MSTDQTWRQQALCHDHPNPDLWFPTEADDIARRAAQAICAQCPVINRCKADATKRREQHGVWGGSDRALPRLRQTRRAAAR